MLFPSSSQILDMLVPEDEADLSDLVLEVTAGVGGQEAMLFTAEMFDMYHSFTQHQGWSFEILDYMKSEMGQWHVFDSFIQTVTVFVLVKKAIANERPNT